eukprot:TRINITY_DN32336_c0_g1_i1.p1 TRINITY_DN32336_c0_g1~~TRINITY_DN32336_c0_g1_i1.p1  ORF type:complete len:306 (+),score=108.71 TRINITY_DN32336_c0_g1_i1:41-919(+)
MSISPDLLRVGAFTDGGQGGNPAGVRIMPAGEGFPPDADMQAEAKAVGYAETAYLVAKPAAECSRQAFAIRYFAPEMEVPFCGHATIASIAALGDKVGLRDYDLHLVTGDVLLVTAGAGMTASFVTPKMWSRPCTEEVRAEYLSAFKFAVEDLDQRFPVKTIGTTVSHIAVFVKTEALLKGLDYDYDRAKQLMQRDGLATASILHLREDGVVLSRNAFPPGGLYEDKATGSAAAALAGYLRDYPRPDLSSATVLQGHFMTPAAPCRIEVRWTQDPEVGATLTGTARYITPEE